MTDTQLTQRENKHILQRIAKVVGIISIVIAFICAGYLLTLTDSEDKVIKAFYGSISFFCFMMGLVLQSIGSANLPDLTVPKDNVIADANQKFVINLPSSSEPETSAELSGEQEVNETSHHINNDKII